MDLKEDSPELAMLRRFIAQLPKNRYRPGKDLKGGGIEVEILDRPCALVVKTIRIEAAEKETAVQLIQ